MTALHAVDGPTRQVASHDASNALGIAPNLDRSARDRCAQCGCQLAPEIDRQSNLITSCGSDATQTVFHLHVHIVPRHAGDGLALPWTEQSAM